MFDENGFRWQGLLGGFILSGTFVARLGTPVDITGTNNALNTATQGSANRPNQTGPSRILGSLEPGQTYFDASVFTAPRTHLPSATSGETAYAVRTTSITTPHQRGLFR